nr:hypothetical protein [Tanacetum cinerariifolium]
MDEFCSRKGIKREFSNARTPQQNGVAKRGNRTLIEASRTMLADAKLPVTFWAEAVNTSCTKEDVHQAVKEKESPLRFIALPNWFHEAQMATSNEAAKKDDAIPDNNAPQKEQEELASSSIVETKVPTVSTSVLKDSLYVPPITSSVLKIILRGGSSYQEPLSLGNAMSFENKLEDLFGDTSDEVSLNDVEADLSNMETAIQANPTPTLRIHKDHPKSQIIGPVETPVQTRQKTKNVNKQSFIATIHQKTNPDLLQYCLLSCFLSKEEPKKIVDALKYPSWEEGIDYKEVFVPVERIEAIRLFLAYASYMGFTVYKMDVKSAFLYGTFDEELCREFEALTHDKFQMTAMGELNFFLGLQVLQKKDGIFLLQDKYVGDILKKFGYTNIRSAKTPMDSENPRGKDGTGKDVELRLYRSMIGSLMYITTSRDIMYLKGHPKLRLWYPKESPFDLVAYSKSDYSGAENPPLEVVSFWEEVETAFPMRDVRYGEAFPAVPSLDAGQVKVNIAKTSAMPHEASPKLKTRVKTLVDNERRREGFAQEDALNIGEMDQREDLLVGDTVKNSDKSADKGSDSTNKMANVLGTLGAANILASRGLKSDFTNASLSVATANTVVSPIVATASGSFPTVVIFTTASVATPTTRVTMYSRGVIIESSYLISVNIPSISKKDKGKEKMTEPEQPKQVERNYEIARIHVERELKIMIAELDRINEMVTKYLSEYELVEAGLSHDEKVEFIDELLMYQRHIAQIKKYQAQQNKPATKTKRRKFYMSILRRNAGWKAKDFKGMTFEQIEEKFISVWEKMQDFVPMNTKLEKQQSEEPKELYEEELKKIMELVPVEELYIEALQVKYPIIDWEMYSKGQRKYWKIIRVGNHTEVYQIFDDMLKKFDREDMDRL